jgi:hypothetical protein
LAEPPFRRSLPHRIYGCLTVKIRDNGHVINKAVYMALGVNLDGNKEVLGLWIEFALIFLQYSGMIRRGLFSLLGFLPFQIYLNNHRVFCILQFFCCTKISLGVEEVQCT